MIWVCTISSVYEILEYRDIYVFIWKNVCFRPTRWYIFPTALLITAATHVMPEWSAVGIIGGTIYQQGP